MRSEAFTSLLIWGLLVLSNASPYRGAKGGTWGGSMYDPIPNDALKTSEEDVESVSHDVSGGEGKKSNFFYVYGGDGDEDSFDSNESSGSGEGSGYGFGISPPYTPPIKYPTTTSEPMMPQEPKYYPDVIPSFWDKTKNNLNGAYDHMTTSISDFGSDIKKGMKSISQKISKSFEQSSLMQTLKEYARQGNEAAVKFLRKLGDKIWGWKESHNYDNIDDGMLTDNYGKDQEMEIEFKNIIREPEMQDEIGRMVAENILADEEAKHLSQSTYIPTPSKKNEFLFSGETGYVKGRNI